MSFVARRLRPMVLPPFAVGSSRLTPTVLFQLGIPERFTGVLQICNSSCLVQTFEQL